jgi:hypothetical protein
MHGNFVAEMKTKAGDAKYEAKYVPLFDFLFKRSIFHHSDRCQKLLGG